MYTYIFEIKEEHMKLLDNAFVSWNDMENGGPSFDPKYPYGDYRMDAGMARLLGVPFEDEDDDELSEENENYMWQLHKEMKAVLEIGIHTHLFSKGFYKKENGEKWKAISSDDFSSLLHDSSTKNIHVLAAEDRYF